MLLPPSRPAEAPAATEGVSGAWSAAAQEAHVSQRALTRCFPERLLPVPFGSAPESTPPTARARVSSGRHEHRRESPPRGSRCPSLCRTIRPSNLLAASINRVPPSRRSEKRRRTACPALRDSRPRRPRAGTGDRSGMSSPRYRAAVLSACRLRYTGEHRERCPCRKRRYFRCYRPRYRR